MASETNIHKQIASIYDNYEKTDTPPEKNICEQIAQVYYKYDTYKKIHTSTLTKDIFGGSIFLTQFKINGALTQFKCAHRITTSISIRQDNNLVFNDILNKSVKLTDEKVLEMTDIFGTKSTIKLPFPADTDHNISVIDNNNNINVKINK